MKIMANSLVDQPNCEFCEFYVYFIELPVFSTKLPVYCIELSDIF